LSGIKLLGKKRQREYLIDFLEDTFEQYLEENYINDYCKTVFINMDDLYEYQTCMDKYLKNRIGFGHKVEIFSLFGYFEQSFPSHEIFCILNKADLKKIPTLAPHIEKPLITLYKSISEQIDGLFYHVEKVPHRGLGYIIHLLIVVPKKNYEVEGRIYKEIGSLMREYPDYLFDFSLVRKDGRDIREISEGYKGYVYP